MSQQTRNMAVVFEEEGISPTHLVHDGDKKFTEQFDDIFESEFLGVIKIPYRSPYMNAHSEKGIQFMKFEALDHFIVLGEDHLNHFVPEYVNYYNKLRHVKVRRLSH